MDKRQLPSVELIQGPTPIAHPEQGRGGWRRWKVFLSILLIAGVAGVVIVYSQSPVYRASAQILTVKPKAIDAKASVADAEHVAIQGRLLLGDDLLGRVGRRLAEADDPVSVDADRLRMLLDVASVPDTNLLELRAEGDDRHDCDDRVRQESLAHGGGWYRRVRAGSSEQGWRDRDSGR